MGHDRGHKYESNEFNYFIRSLGIIFWTTLPYSPTWNGFAKNKNRTFVELTYIQFFAYRAKCTYKFMGEIILTAVMCLNCVPCKKYKLTIFELWKGYKSSLRYLSVWNYSLC